MECLRLTGIVEVEVAGLALAARVCAYKYAGDGLEIELEVTW